MPVYDRTMSGTRVEAAKLYDRDLAGTRRQIARVYDRNLAGTRHPVYQYAPEYLYRAGDVCNAYTGGWQNAAQVVAHTGEWMQSAEAGVQGPASLVTGASSGYAYRGCGMMSAKAVDLKSLASLTLRYTPTGTGSGRVLVFAACTGAGGILLARNILDLAGQGSGEATLVLNVSGISIGAYVYVGVFASANVRFAVEHHEIGCTWK